MTIITGNHYKLTGLINNAHLNGKHVQACGPCWKEGVTNVRIIFSKTLINVYNYNLSPILSFKEL